MIGRSDVIFQTPLPREETLDLCARQITERWPACVFENAETAEVYASYSSVPFGEVRELFVYRDAAAYESWDELGADESNANTMVHLLSYGDHTLTVVVDDVANYDSRAILDGVRESLSTSSAKR